MVAARHRRPRASSSFLALAALVAALCFSSVAHAQGGGASTTTSQGNGRTSTVSSSHSRNGAPAVASASSTQSGGGGALPPPGACVVASKSSGQACGGNGNKQQEACCQVAQELQLCMPSWAKPDGKSAPPPPIPRAYAAVANGPAVPCCVMLSDQSRNGALVPFCADDPASAQRDGFLPLPSGAVVTKVTPACAAGDKAPSGFKYGTVACTVAFPEGTLPKGFSPPGKAGDYSSAKAPLVVDGVGNRAAPCGRAGGGYGRLLQVASVVPAGKEGPDGEPPGTLRVTSKCE
jgi:hypothetical protein